MIDVDQSSGIHSRWMLELHVKKAGVMKKALEYLRNCLYTYHHESGRAFRKLKPVFSQQTYSFRGD